MSSSVDNRIVEMKFDNDQFENGVATTMSTLKKFKEALSFDGATKGLESIETAANNIDLNTIEENTNKLAQRFSILGEVAVTAIHNITNKIVNLGTQMLKSVTIDPIIAGFSEYELKMNSVQTIMNGTGASLDQVNAKLEELNEYADQTIYSFSDMTSNIGKFTNAGVDLDTAVAAIKGVSNWAAVSGANANEASRAMYNLSQSLSGGFVQYIDWKSIENANMATMDVKTNILRTAAAIGTLNKEQVEQALATKDAAEINSFFKDGLKDRWLTTEVLMTVMEQYSTDVRKMTEAEVEAYEAKLKTLGYTDEQIEEIKKLGIKANDAATTVKTFTQMMDTLKEAVGSGWAQTFEYIFGDFEEAKVLWTTLSGVLEDIFASSAKTRNELLKEWSNAPSGGRSTLFEALGNLGKSLYYFDEEAGRHIGLFGVIKDAFSDMFPLPTVDTLVAITKSFRDFTAALVPSESTLDKIYRTVSGILAPIRLLGKVIKGVVYALSPILRLVGDLFGISLDMTATIGDWSVQWTGLIEAFLDGTGIFQKVHDVLSAIITVIEKVVKGIANLITNTGIFTDIWAFIVDKFGKAKDFLKEFGLFKSITKGVEDFTKNVEASADKFVQFIDKSGVIQYWGEWFRAAWANAKDFFASLDIVGKLSAAWSTVTTWFNNAKTAVADFFQNSEFIQKASGWLQELGNTLKKIDLGTVLMVLVAPIGAVAYGLYALGKAIVKFVQDCGLLETIWNVIKGIGSALYDFGVKVIGYISPYFDKLGDKFDAIKTKLGLFARILKTSGMGDALKYLFRTPLKSMDEFKKKMTAFVESSPFLQKLADKFDAFRTKMGLFYRILKNVGLGEALKYLFRTPIQSITALYDKIQNFVNTNPILQKVREKFGEFADSIQAAWDKFKNTDWLAKIEGAKTKIGEFVDKVKNFVATNPQIQAIREKFSELGDKIAGAWEKLKNTDWLEKITSAFQTAKTRVTDFIDKIKEFWNTNETVQKLKEKFGEFGDKVGEVFNYIITNDWIGTIVGAYENLKTKIGEAIEKVRQFVTENETIQNIIGFFQPIIDKVRDFIDTYGSLDGMHTLITTAITNIKEYAQNTIDFISEHGVIEWIKQSLSNLVDHLGELGDKLKTFVMPILDKVKGKLGEVLEKLQGFLSSKFTGFIDTLKKKFSGAKSPLDVFKGIGESIVSFIEKHDFGGLSKKIQPFLEIIGEGIKKVFGAMKSMDVVGILTRLAPILIALAALKGFSALNNFSTALKNWKKDSLGTSLLKIAGAIAIMAGALYLLSTVKNVWGAVAALAAVVGVLIVLSLVISQLADNKDSANRFTKIAGSMIGLVVSILLLMVVIKLIEKSDISFKTITDNLEKFVVIFGLLFVLAGIGRLAGKGGGGLVGLVVALGLLLLVIKALSLFSDDELKRGAIVVGVLALILGVLAILVGVAGKLSGGKGLKGLGSTFIAMAVAIGVMAICVGALGKLDKGTLAKGAIALGAMVLVMGVFLLMASKAKSPNVYKSIYAAVVMIGVIAVAMWALKDIPWQQLIGTAGAIAIVAVALGAVMLAWSKIGVSWKSALAGAIGSAILLAAITAAMYFMPKDDIRMNIANALILGGLALVMMVVMLAWSKLGVSWSSALAGAIGSGILLAAIVLAMRYMPTDNLEANKTNAIILGALAVVLGIVMVAWSKLGVNWSSALAGAVGSGILLLAIAAAMNYMPTDAETNKANARVIEELAAVLALVLLAWRFIDIDFNQVLTSVVGCGAILAEIVIAMSYMPQDAETNKANARVIEELAVVLAAVLAAWRFIDIDMDAVINSIIACGGILAEIVIAMSYMPQDAETNKANARVIEELAGVLSLVLAAWEFVDIDMDAVLAAIVGIGGILGEIVLAMTYMPEDTEANIANARMIEELAAVLTGVIGAFSVIGVGGAFAGATAAIVGIGEFLVGIEGIIAAVGAIAEIPGVDAAIDKGVEVIGKIGTAFGDLVGNFLKEVLEGLADGLTKLADTLTQFMNDITPFLDHLNSLDNDIETKIGILMLALGALMAADFLTNLSDFFTRDGSSESGLVKFGKRLQEFSGPFVEFVDAIIGCGTDNSLTAAAAIADAVAAFANIKTGGLGELFTGSNNLKKFGEQLQTFGPYFASFMNSLTGVNWTQANNAVTSFKNFIPLLSDIQSLPYNSGGWGEGSGFDQAMQRLCNIPQQVIDSLSGANVQGALDTVTNFVSQITGLFKPENVSNEQKTDLSQFGKLIAERIKSGLTTYSYVLTDKVKEFCGAESGILKWFHDNLPETSFTDDIAKALIVEKIALGMETHQPVVVTQAETLAQAIIDAIKGILTDETMQNIGLNAAKGLAKGMTSDEATRIINEAGMSAGNAAKTSAQKALDEHSPSKVFYDIGMYAMMGFANGIAQNTAMVLGATEESAMKTINGFNHIAEMIAAAFDENLIENPVITPVLDLTNVSAGTAQINSMLSASKASLIATGVGGSKSDLASAFSAALKDYGNNGDGLGGVTINVYGAPGQDVNELADAVSNRLSAMVQRKKAVYR